MLLSAYPEKATQKAKDYLTALAKYFAIPPGMELHLHMMDLDPTVEEITHVDVMESFLTLSQQDDEFEDE